MTQLILEGVLKMSKRNHRELWEQMKAITLCGGKRRYTQSELYKIMLDLEVLQLAQDPLSELLGTSRKV